MATLILVVLVVGGLPVMLLVRLGALRHRSASASGPPLSDAELAPLRAWQGRMMGMFRIAMTTVGLTALLLVILVFTHSVAPWLYWLMLIVATVIVAVGIGVQFSARCPRCGYNIGLGSRLRLPHRCERCQARFRA